MGIKKNTLGFSDIVVELSSYHRRRFILDFLNHAAQYKSNQKVLQDACGYVGLSCCLSVMNKDLIFLEQANLVELNQYENYQVVTLLESDLDVSNGVISANGIVEYKPKS